MSKYYLAQICERNGEYTYEHTIAVALEHIEATIHDALTDIAMYWYDDEAQHDPEDLEFGQYYFNGGEVCCAVGSWQEITEKQFEELPFFISRYVR